MRRAKQRDTLRLCTSRTTSPECMACLWESGPMTYASDRDARIVPSRRCSTGIATRDVAGAPSNTQVVRPDNPHSTFMPHQRRRDGGKFENRTGLRVRTFERGRRRPRSHLPSPPNRQVECCTNRRCTSPWANLAVATKVEDLILHGNLEQAFIAFNRKSSSSRRKSLPG